MAARVEMRTEGLREAALRFSIAPAAMRRRRRQRLRQAGRLVAASAKRHARRRTGKLRRSIRSRLRADGLDADTVEIGPSDPVFYGHLIERGTVRTQAFPFLEPAADETESEVVDLVGDTFQVV